jgi:hypothetical protein
MLDYTLFNNEEEQPQVGLLKKTRAKIQSPGGVLSNNVRPGQGGMLPNAIDSYRSQSKELSDRAFAAMDAPVDYSAMQQMARDRTEQGDGAMLNALAAQFAGEQFAPVQQQMLKRASAARDPIKMAGGLITPEGNFVKDPEAARDKEVNMLLQRSAELSRIAETADTARERIAAQRAQNELQNQMRLMGLDLQRQGLAMRGDSVALQRMLAGQAVNDRKEKSINEGTQKLSKQSEDLTNLVSGVRELTGALAPYLATGKNIPGVGYGTNISALGLDLSGALIGKEGKANRSLVRNVSNELLRLASGQAVTIGETERQNLALMATGNYSEQDFLNALQNVIIPKVNEAVANVGAGYTPEIKGRYRDQGGRIDFNKPFEVPARAKPQAAPSSNLSAQEQAELNALRSRYQRPPGERP